MVTSAEVYRNSTLVEVIDDLCVRFIINLPSHEINSVERVYFQIEEAQWFYEDFVRKVNPNLPALTLRMFSAKVFAICPVLQKWGTKHENSLNRFMEYKQKVPVRGAIILNETLDKCVLVKAYKSQSYSFPRGKINKDELDLDCAAREVLEETGFELKELLEEENSLSLNIRQQDVKLYIVPGVSEDTVFCPRTRGEIAAVEWMRLADLPSAQAKRSGTAPPGSSKFYMVTPFVGKIRQWIATKGARWLKQRNRQVPLMEEVYGPEASEESPRYEEGDYQHSPHYSEEYEGMYEEEEEGVRIGGGVAPDPVEEQSAALRSLLGLSLSNHETSSGVSRENCPPSGSESRGTYGNLPPIPTNERAQLSSTAPQALDSKNLLSLLKGDNGAPKNEPTPSTHPSQNFTDQELLPQFTRRLGSQGNGSYSPASAQRILSSTIEPNTSGGLLDSFASGLTGSSFNEHTEQPGKATLPAQLTEQSATLLRTLKSGLATGTAQKKPGLLSPEVPLMPKAVEAGQARSLLTILRSGQVGTASASNASPKQLSPTQELNLTAMRNSPAASSASQSMAAFFPQLSNPKNNSVEPAQKISLLATLQSREPQRRMSSTTTNHGSPVQSVASNATSSIHYNGLPLNGPNGGRPPADSSFPMLANINLDRRNDVNSATQHSLLAKFRNANNNSQGRPPAVKSPEAASASSISRPQPAPKAQAPTPTDQGFLFSFLEQVSREAQPQTAQ